MDPITIGVGSLVVVTVLILLGMHIGVALAITSFVGVYLIGGMRSSVPMSMLANTSYNAIADYVFAVIPLFVLMGLLAMAAGATRELFQAARAMLGRTGGGVGIATVVANAIFAAVTGVSVASAAIFSRLAVPEMNRLNYNHRFSLGIVASSALLGMLIPPSVLMIIYALLTDQSIGALFAAGVAPGLLVAFALSLAIWVMVRLNPALGGADEGEATEPGSKLKVLLSPWAIYLLILLVLGGIYGGVFTPTEAGAVGAIGAFAIYVARGRFSLREMGELLLETGRATSSIFFLFITASLYSRMLAVSGLPVAAARWVVALDLPPIWVVLAFVGVILIMGCFIDSVSILLLSMPIMVPVIRALGYDLIWFGIVAIVAVEIGLLTPPFGMVLFVMKASLPYKVDLSEIVIGSVPFIGVLLIVLGILIAFPSFTLALPKLLF
ncbi:MAG: TRAP transporter large permease [Hyphomicrobiaceae bacterium]|nr:TRAP transporter large permease [Hyphomicrobiaceae bacterium]